jgi:hypothetical protein
MLTPTTITVGRITSSKPANRRDSELTIPLLRSAERTAPKRGYSVSVSRMPDQAAVCWWNAMRHTMSRSTYTVAQTFLAGPRGRARIIVRRVILIVAPGKCCGACPHGSLAASRRTRGGRAT